MSKKKKWILAGVIIAVILIAGGIYAHFALRDAETLKKEELSKLPSTVLVGYLEGENRYVKMAEVNPIPGYKDKLKYKLGPDGKRIKDADGKAIPEADPDGNELTNFYAFYSKDNPGEEIRIYTIKGSPEEAARQAGFAETEETSVSGKAGHLGKREETESLILGFFMESPYSGYSVAATVTMRDKPETTQTDKDEQARALLESLADRITLAPEEESLLQEMLTDLEKVTEADAEQELSREEKGSALLASVIAQITPEKQMAAIEKDFRQNFLDDNRWTFLTNGLVTTLEITLFAVLLGIAIGVLVAVVRSTWDQNAENMRPGLGKSLLGIVNGICKTYLTVIRGTPVVVQLMIIYYVIFAGAQNGTLIGSLAFGINSGAYVAEIIRGGIMAVDRGQLEAGRSLGFNYVQTMRHIIVPQALKSVLPALANEFIVLLKETSVAGYVAVMDLTKGGETIRGLTYSPFMPLLAVALIYLVVVMFFTWLVGRLERRLRSSDH